MAPEYTTRTGLDAEGRRFALVAAGLGVLTVAATLFVLGGALDGPFLWDDRKLVLEPLEAGRMPTIVQALARPFWQPLGDALGSYYRPVTLASLSLDAAIHGTNPFGYHLTNLLLHGVATGLLFVLAVRGRRAVASQLLAAALALAFGLHPRLVEAAAWIAGRTDVLAGLFTLLVCVLHGPSRPRRALATIAACAALGSKESGLAAVAALFVLELRLATAREDLAPLSLARRLASAALAPSLAVAPYLVGRAVFVGLGERAVAMSPGARLALSVEALGRVGAGLAWPFSPAAIQGSLQERSTPFVLAGVVTGAVLLALALKARRPEVQTGLVLLLAAILPVLHLVPIPLVSVAADRCLYLPLAALAWMVAAVTAPRRAPWATLALVPLLVASGIAASARVSDFADDIRFWTVTVRQSPFSSTAWNELGNVMLRDREPDVAATCFRASMSRAVDGSVARRNLALALAAGGHYDESLSELEQASREPRTADGEYDLALGQARLLRFVAARDRLARCLAIDPVHAGCRDLTGALADAAPHLDELRAPGAPAVDRLRWSLRLGRAHEAVVDAVALMPVSTGEDLELATRTVLRDGSDAEATAALARYRESPGPHSEATLALGEERVATAERVARMVRPEDLAAAASARR